MRENVYQRALAEQRVVPDLHMSGQLNPVGQHHVVADVTIVRDVGVGTDPTVTAHDGDAPALCRGDVEGAVLLERVVVTDLQARRLTLVSLVLRYGADGRELVHAVVAAETGVAGNHRVRADRGAGPDLHVLVDDGVGADLDAGGELGTPMHDGGRMNHGLALTALNSAR
jgi:hypothetical protein